MQGCYGGVQDENLRPETGSNMGYEKLNKKAGSVRKMKHLHVCKKD